MSMSNHIGLLASHRGITFSGSRAYEPPQVRWIA